ncbi:hypothetical protein T01_8769 [Trichinella spiralis]|uniref:Uncharacterized protein n=1 Tax=Trichinella spiralis TaxID=6334 RepID=A0A0V1AW39_TRISP|nr:hypothetical protein T01_8769 [Trichinella spiralis]
METTLKPEDHDITVWRQKEGEAMTEFINAFRSLADGGEFDVGLNECLRQQLSIAINNPEEIQELLQPEMKCLRYGGRKPGSGASVCLCPVETKKCYPRGREGRHFAMVSAKTRHAKVFLQKLTLPLLKMNLNCSDGRTPMDARINRQAVVDMSEDADVEVFNARTVTSLLRLNAKESLQRNRGTLARLDRQQCTSPVSSKMEDEIFRLRRHVAEHWLTSVALLDEVWLVYTQWRKSTAGSVNQSVRPWIWSGAVTQIAILLDKTCEYSRLRLN